MAYSTRNLPGNEQVRGELQNLAEDAEVKTSADLVTTINVDERVDAALNQKMRLQPPPQGQRLTLPPPQRGSLGDEVHISLEAPEGALTVTALPYQDGARGALIRNTVNGLERVTFSATGHIVFRSNGDTRWNSVTQLSAASEAARAAASAGTPGATGATGAQGERGFPGIPGEQGEQGPEGIPGQAGARGATGLQGAPGEKGDQGDQGDPGPPGADGAPGATGGTGPAGAAGAAGPPGQDGVDGQDGAPGPPGATGATGPAGGGGGGSILVPITVNLGAVPLVSGSFDITGLSGLTLNDPVLVATGVSLTDPTESEEQLALSGIAISTTAIRVYWESLNGPVYGSRVFNYLVASGVTVGVGSIAVQDDGVSVLTAASTLNLGSGISGMSPSAGVVNANLNMGNQVSVSVGGLITLADTTEMLLITADLTIDGITVPPPETGGAGRMLIVRTNSGITCSFTHLSGSVLATETIATPGSISIASIGSRGAAILVYQNAVWRLFAFDAQPNPNEIVNATATGNLGTIDISALGHGGTYRVSAASSDYSIEGFTAKAKGFWFSFVSEDAGDTAILFNEDATATATNRLSLPGQKDVEAIELRGIFVYNGSRWSWMSDTPNAIGTSANFVEVADNGAIDITSASGADVTVTTSGAGDINLNPGANLLYNGLEVGYKASPVATSEPTATNATTNLSCGGTYTIQANTLEVGSLFRLFGYYAFTRTLTTSPSLICEILVNAVVVESATFATTGAAGTLRGKWEGYLRVDSLGAPGTAMISLVGQNNIGANEDDRFPGSTGTGTINIDTTVSRTLQMRTRMVTAVAANTLTVTQGFIERLA